MRTVVFVFIFFLVQSCIPCDPPIIVDLGPLSEEQLQLVPYKDKQTYMFRHNQGQVISFVAERGTTQEQTYSSHCSKYEYLYEMNTTYLIPDYPVFNIVLWLSNPMEEEVYFNLNVGTRSFYMPTDFSNSYFPRKDSVWIIDQFYYNVFQLKSQSDYYQSDSIYADSIYYNFDYGILKIIMSNDENFTIYE